MSRCSDGTSTSSRLLGRLAWPRSAAIAPVPATARFDIVVDVTGRPDGLRRALELVKPRGTVVMKSTFHGEAPVATWPVVVDEVTLARFALRPVSSRPRSSGFRRRPGQAADFARRPASTTTSRRSPKRDVRSKCSLKCEP